MKRKLKTLVLAVALIACAPLRAGLILDHPPLNTGGLASDTSFITSLGVPFSQRLADDITLAEPAEINFIRWWAFYDRDNPPTQEMIRIRFYGARLSDGLPDEGNLVAEQNLNNPSRMATGRRIAVGIAPHEYLFQSSIDSPVPLAAGIKYWLEIVQIGDISTHYRVEFSTAELSDFASQNINFPNWAYTGLQLDNAFQLYSAPEPSAAVIALALVIPALIVRRQHRPPG